MIPSAVARPIVVLTSSQVGAMLANSAGGLAAWLIAARMMPPAEVGAASAIVALGTLVSGVVAAGLGQYMLAALPQQRSAERRRSMLLIVGAALVATPIAAVLAGVAAYGALLETALLVLYAVSVTATNTQDSVFLCAGSAGDIVAKALVISVVKPPLVIIAAIFSSQRPVDPSLLLVLALLAPGLTVGLAWQVVRAPLVVRMIPEPTATGSVHHRSLLSVGYLYALSSSLVSWGVPALATNLLAPAISALFYVAWTVASLVGSVAAAAANVVVARTRRAGETLKATPIILVLGGFFLILVTVILLFAPLVFGVFGTYYQRATPILAVLLVGQVFSGVGAVLIGLARRTAPARDVAVAISTWAIGGFGLPTFAAWSGAAEFLAAYAVGSGVSLALIVLALRPQAPRQAEVAPTVNPPEAADRLGGDA